MAERVQRDIGVFLEPDLKIEDHGFLMLSGHFNYAGGGCQGLGYDVDADFIRRFLGVFGVTHLRHTGGKPCWVTRIDGMIRKLEPIHPQYGKPFDIEEWGRRREDAP